MPQTRRPTDRPTDRPTARKGAATCLSPQLLTSRPAARLLLVYARCVYSDQQSPEALFYYQRSLLQYFQHYEFRDLYANAVRQPVMTDHHCHP